MVLKIPQEPFSKWPIFFLIHSIFFLVYSRSLSTETIAQKQLQMITDLTNQITVEVVILAEWELNSIVNCYKGKDDSLEKENYRGLILTD